ncbi:unnamed protein product [Mesocestoides corti]|uniref:Leucine-rich repeat-containing protein 57 n=1 Tax=Mesocestoides corti TaxID=53468 RepID=A0A3P6H862_MESCO|nr:unnamed protein product [Mesocestoides corti]
MKHLRILDLSCNGIHSLDPWIGLLSSLKLLNVSGNKLVHLPTDITLLTKLEVLNVSMNRLTSLISSSSSANFETLRNLRTVDLSGNNISEFPVELCSEAIPLDLLDLSKNDIAIVPTCIESLQAIELNLNSNKVSVVAESIGKCPRLRVLRLAHNRLRLEDFPLEILEKSNVSLLAIEGNPLSVKALQEHPSYAKYMERYTATKRKAMP